MDWQELLVLLLFFFVVFQKVNAAFCFLFCLLRPRSRNSAGKRRRYQNSCLLAPSRFSKFVLLLSPLGVFHVRSCNFFFFTPSCFSGKARAAKIFNFRSTSWTRNPLKMLANMVILNQIQKKKKYVPSFNDYSFLLICVFFFSIDVSFFF